jgi:hypothetical protein
MRHALTSRHLALPQAGDLGLPPSGFPGRRASPKESKTRHSYVLGLPRDHIPVICLRYAIYVKSFAQLGSNHRVRHFFGLGLCTLLVVFAVYAKMGAYAPTGTGRKNLAATKICSAESAIASIHVKKTERAPFPLLPFTVTGAEFPDLRLAELESAQGTSTPLYAGGLTIAFASRPPPTHSLA